MLLIGAVRYLLGSVRFTARGGSTERFLNQASRSGVNLWNIRCRDGTLTACVRARSFKKLRAAVRKSRVRLHIEKRRGLPFLFYRYRKRKGIFAGAALFLLLLWFLSGFVWTIGITGNSKVSSQEISGTLEELGVKPGCYRPLLDLHGIEQEVLLKLPDLSWISINIKGSHAAVLVKERTFHSELVPYNVPCNVKASCTGQIVKLEVYEGVPAVRKGDAVSKGDLIASGIIEESTGVYRYAHASAKAVARTEHELSVRVDYTQKIHAPTGKKVIRRELIVGGFSLPLSFGAEPKGDYAKTISVSLAELFGMQIPFGIRTSGYAEFGTKTVTLTPEEAERQARLKMSRKEALEFSNVTVLKKSYAVEKEAAALTLKGSFSCEEDIAYEEEIKIN